MGMQDQSKDKANELKEQARKQRSGSGQGRDDMSGREREQHTPRTPREEREQAERERRRRESERGRPEQDEPTRRAEREAQDRFDQDYDV
ncbi:hypothetical protein FE633_41755 [Streptomyces montanus]|uniref:Uncharacterized protein n=1 Tax=Streptomyces montanus TaxID=2580423 RepID=A0A5R9F9H0_9ACTN|nr:hypothetical protein [Streptomyces montanus]TLS40402.1 hypothetical protein FE633_41755 [Streptomyces montanus]